jgi:ATP-binding cassette subfamily C protein LapB
MPSDTIDIDNSSTHKKISSHSIATCVLSNFGIQTSVAGIAAIQAVNPYEWSTADIIDTFSELEISAKEITVEDLRSRQSLPTSQVIYLITFTDLAYVVQFDLQTNEKVIVPVDGSPDKTIFGLIKLVKKNKSSATIFECSFKSEPKSSLLPFLDSHWFWSGILKNSNNYIKSGFAVLLTNVFALGTSMFSMVVYNRIIPANAIESLYALVFGMGLLLAVDFMTRQIRGEFLSVASNYADTAISDKLFEQIVDLKRGNRKITFSSVSSALKEFEQMREFFTSAGVVGLIDIPFAIIFLIAMWIIGQWMVLPVILVILVMVIHALISQPRLSALSKKSFAQSQTKNQVIFETLLGLEEIKLSNSGGFMRKRFNEATRQQVLVTDQSKSSANLSSTLAYTLQQVTQISVVAIGAILVHDGKYGYGAIIACTILSGKALAPFVQLSQMLNKLSQINTSYKSLTELMAAAREHPTKKEFFPIKSLNGKIEFDSVFFKYSGQSSYALDNISIKIAPGEKIAILGRLGSGKTTLGRLITQLYEAEKGSIYLDGVDIRQISPSDIRRHVGMCTQQQWLLTETIEKNISLGRFDITGEDIRQAAYISCLSEFINQYPDGYKHVIEDRGESLSGGQRQAICLARALCKRPSMLILDEPTNSFDNATESLFIDRFSQQEIEGTLILITHRLALLKLVDRIIIVDKGKIVKDIPKADFLKSGNIARAETKPAVRVS